MFPLLMFGGLLFGGALLLKARKAEQARKEALDRQPAGPLGIMTQGDLKNLTPLQQQQIQKFTAIGALAGASTGAVLGMFAVSASVAGPVGAIVAGAIAAVGVFRGTAHIIANEWVNGVQNQFGAALIAVADENAAALANGSATVRSVELARQTVTTLWSRYKTAADQYKALGADYKTVIDQSYQTLDYLYVNGVRTGSGLVSRVIASMDADIARLSS